MRRQQKDSVPTPVRLKRDARAGAAAKNIGYAPDFVDWRLRITSGDKDIHVCGARLIYPILLIWVQWDVTWACRASRDGEKAPCRAPSEQQRGVVEAA